MIKKEVKDIILGKADLLLCDIVKHHSLEKYLTIKTVNGFSYHYFDEEKYLLDKKFEYPPEGIEVTRHRFLLNHSRLHTVNIFLKTLVEEDFFIEKSDFRKLNKIYREYKNNPFGDSTNKI